MNFRVYIKKRLPNGTFSEEICVQDGFSGIKEYTLLDPVLHKTKNAAGSFECTFHVDSAIYNTKAPDGKPWIERMKTHVIIRRHKNAWSKGTIVWEGRVLTSEFDFYNQEHIYAEGALSYLNDSIQEKKTFTNGQTYGNARYILSEIIAFHNSKCPDKAMQVMTNTPALPPSWPDEATEFSIDNETTMSAVSKLISFFGGNVRIVYENDNAVLEWYSDNAVYANPYRGTAQIVFAKNLLDVTKKYDATNLITAIFPRGYKAYSGGSDAIGDDMFAPTDGSDVSPITWTKGAYIWRPKFDEYSDVRTCAYEYVSDESGYHQTAATGFEDRAGGLNPDKSLEVHSGEVYYISLIQSDGRSCYVVTVNKLGNNPAILIGYQDAANTYYPYRAENGTVQYPTTWSFHKITIPDKPTDPSLTDRPMYLNVSCRGDFGNDDSYSGKGNMGIWKGRKIPDGCDEYITLKGLGDGSYSKYFYTDPTTNETVVLDVPSQSGKDRTILYPKSEDDGTVETVSDLPDTAFENRVYFVEDTGSRYAMINGEWWPCKVTNVSDLNTINFGKTGTSVYVTSTGEWYVRIVSDNGSTATWYPQKEFVRNGYTISMKELTDDYGWVEKIDDDPTVADPDTLEELALYRLYMSYFENIELTVKAIDMTIIDSDVDPALLIDILDPVEVASPFHGLGGTFYIQEFEIPLNNLPETTVDIGYQTTVRLTRD